MDKNRCIANLSVVYNAFKLQISTGNRHDLGSGNAKLQPEAARESWGEVCEDYSMQNLNLIVSNRHLQPTDGSAARSLYMGAYTPKHSLGWMYSDLKSPWGCFISLLFKKTRIHQKQLMQTIAKFNKKYPKFEIYHGNKCNVLWVFLKHRS